MRLVAVCLLTLSLASAGAAQLTPGFIVQSGEPFPIIADFNGDGLDDLIQERNVILNDGISLGHEFALGLPLAERITGVLDVNGDHILDLLTVERSPIAPPTVPQGPLSEPYYRLYIADASRTYSTPIEISVGPHPYAADVDADGRDDLLVMASISSNDHRASGTDVTVLRSLGDGTFERLTPIRIPESVQIELIERVLSGDLNHDGLPDLVIRCPEDLLILRGTGGGRFAVEDRYIPMDLKFGWWSTRLADIDGDTNLDVIMPMQRGVRVFFGDGRGNFPRTTAATIAKLHDAAGLPAGVPLDVDRMNQPRNLALGYFTRGDRMQIAAGTGEGDIVVFSYEQGALKEVSRTRTEFWLLDIRSGSFHRADGTDLYVMGTLIWGDMFPRPRLFYGAEDLAISDRPVRPPARRRASRPAASELALQVQIRGDCMDAAADRFVFARDGVFGSARRDQTTIEAVFDAPLIYFRLSAPYIKGAVTGVLAEANGAYRGVVQVLTACGWRDMTVTATMD